ncbi:MAG: hypothetical protein IPO83_19320 [Chitinophagaceae bacterium]|nr:hypothetical protein [Chitinophagaceae bacterium]
MCHPNPASSNSITMTVNPSPAVPIISVNGPLTFCGPGAVKLWSQYSGSGILWSTGATTDTITVSSSNSITVTYSALGCSSTSAATVVTINNANAIITPSSASVCTGGTITLTASATPAATSYLWSPGGATTNTITAGAGTYSVITNDGNGCMDTASITINTNASPTVTLSSSCGTDIASTLYPGGSVTLTAAALPGSGTITTYQWVLNGVTNVGTGLTTYSTNVAGSYTVIVTNSNGCATTSTANVVSALSGALAAGTYVIPSNCGFQTIAAAASYVNTNGIAGAVIFNVTSGYSETTPAKGIALGSATLNPTLSALNTLTIQKSAAGAVTLNATAGTSTGPSATPDGLFYLNGADFVTIDGLTFTDGNGATNIVAAEFGLAFFKRTAGDGCNNNTIKNCIFNMQRINNGLASGPMFDGSWGIEVMNSTVAAATTALTPTNGGTLATNGTNSNNKFYSNTTNNGNGGIGLSGFAASSGVGPSPVATTFLGDIGNDIGGSSSVTGNTVLNFGGLPAAANPSAGIRANNQWSVNISFNTVNNNNGSGVNHVTTLRGIFAQAGTSGNATINNNTVTIQSGATTSACTGIDNVIGSTALSNTVSISNNIVNCGYSTATTGVFTGISNTATATTVNVNGNKITGTGANSLAGTGTHVMIETGSPITANANNNRVYNLSRGGASGSWRGIKTTSPTNYNANADTVENLSWTAAASTGSMDGIYSLSSAVNVTVTNCVVRNLSTPTTGTITGITEFGISGLKTFQNNQIYNFSTTAGGAGGATLRGISESTGSTNEFSGNQIYSLNSTGSTGGTSGTVVGIIVSSGTTNNIFKNKIYDLSTTSTGPTVTGVNITGGTTANISNNLIGDLRASAANAANAVIGINASSGTTNNVYYNTVYLNASSSGALFSSSGVFFGTSATLNLRNNIIVNLSSFNGATNTAALRRSSGTAATIPANYANTSNNNMFYAGTPGAGNLLYVEGTVTTFTNPQSSYSGLKTFMSSRDQASASETVSSTPGVYFQSFTGANAGFLHMVTGITTQVESGASNIATFTDDYDGHIRNGNAGYPGGTAGFPTGGSAPDMGADEFSGVLLDLTAPVISYSSLSNACTADRTLTATITDGSGVPITGVLVPRIYYSKDGINYFSQAGTLTSGTGQNGTWSFNIVSTDFGGAITGNVISYYIIAQDTLPTPNIGSNASGAVATNVNTVTTHPSTPSTFTIIASPINLTATATPSSICNNATSSLTASASLPFKTGLPFTLSSLTGQTYTTLSGGGITIINTAAQLTAGFSNASQDDGGVLITLPFTFNYLGSNFTTMSMSTNGWVAAGSSMATITAGPDRTPANLFANALPNNTIAPWFRDMGANFPTGGGSMRHGLIGTDVYAFQWDKAVGSGFSDGSSILTSFQVNIYGPASSAPGRIEFIYGPAVGAIATGTAIGLEDATGGTPNHFMNALDGTPTSTTLSSAWPGNGNGYRFSTTPPEVPGATYAWSPASSLVTSTGATVATTNLTTTTIYTVTVNDPSNGCTATANTTVTVGAPLDLTVNTPAAICAGQTTTLTAVPTGGGTPFSYEWSPALGLSATTGVTVNANPATTTVYQVIVSDNCGVKDTAYSTVTVNPVPTVSVTPSSATICGIGTVNLVASGSAATYTWAPATGLSPTTGASVNASPTSTITYTVTANDGTCTNTATAVITVSPGVGTATATASATTACADGTVNLFGGPSSSPATALSENFDAVVAPALPVGWTATNISGSAPLWVTTITSPSSSPNAIFIDDPASVSDKRIESPNITVAAGPATLTFSQMYTFESATSFFDGGVLEISIDGGTFTDILAAGGSFVSGGYVGTISSSFSNPLAGRSAWATNTGGLYINTVINLPAAVVGHSIKLRWRFGSDTSTGAAGWFIDNIAVNQPASNNSFSWYSVPPGFTSALQNPTGVSVPATTTYNVIVSNPEGCSDTGSVTVTVGDPLSVSVPDVAICSGHSTTLTASVTGGGAPFHYTWAPGLSDTTSSVTVSPLSTTTYTVTVLDNCGTIATDTVQVTVNPTPTVTISPSPANAGICGTGSVTLVATGTATSFTWEPATGLDVTTGSTVVATPVSTTTYTVTASSANGCTITATQTVTVVPTITLVASASPSTVCSNATSQLSASASVPITGGYSLTSTSFAPVVPSVSTSPGPSGDDATLAGVPIGFNFTFFGTTFSTVTISTNGFISFDAAPGSGCCSGQLLPSATTPNNLIAAAWEDLNTTVGGTIDFFTQGSGINHVFVVRYNAVGHHSTTGGGGDPVTTQIVLYESSNIIEIHTTSMPQNPNGAIWNPHTQGIENADGTVAVVDNARNANTTWTLTNDAVRFAPSSPVNFTYAWLPPTFLDNANAQNPVATNVTTSTVYTVTATSTGGCTQSDTVNVVSVPVPTDPIGHDSTQCGLDVPSVYVTSTSGLPTPGYHWYLNPSGGTALSGETLNHLTAYTINATDTFYVTEFNGQCESNRVRVISTVTQPDVVTASVAPSPVCLGSSTVVTAVQTGTTNNYQYSWTAFPATGSGIPGSASGQSVSITPTAAGSYHYIVIATDTTAGCATIDTTGTLTVNPNPDISSVTATPSNICFGGTSTLEAVSGNFANANVILGSDNAASKINTVGTPYRTGTTTGISIRSQYLILQSELATAGITAGDIQSLGLFVTNSPTGFISNMVISMGNTGATAMTTTFLTDPVSPVYSIPVWTPVTGLNNHPFATSFYWDGMSNILINICGDLTVAGSGSGTTLQTFATPFMSTVANNTTCSVATGSNPTTTGTRPVFQFNAVTGVNSTGSNDWVWMPGSLMGNTVNVSPAGTTTYTVTATDTITSCSSTDTVTVHVGEPLVVSVNSDTICAGGSTTLTTSISGGGYPYSYLWSPGGATTSSITVSPVSTTSYNVMVIDFCGDTMFASGTVTVDTLPVLAVTPFNPSICTGGSVALSVTGANTYTWSPSLGLTPTTGASVTANPTVNTTYTVTGTNGNGCVSTTTAVVAVLIPPTITSVTADLASICAGGSSTLTANAFQAGAMVNNYSLSNISGQVYTPLSGAGITTINDAAQLLTGFSTGSQDDGGVLITLPFAFTYNGSSFNQMTMSTNGWIGAGNGNVAITAGPDRTAGNLFTTTLPNNTIAAWFKDMGANFGAGFPGSMRHGLIGTQVYAFQWDQAVGSSFSTTTSILISFQINIYGPLSASPGRIEMIYGPTAGAISFAAAIGIEDATGGTDHYINALNGSGNSTTTSAAWPGDGNGFRFNPLPPTSLTYSWSPAATIADSTANPASASGINATTVYTVTVTNAGGCSSSATTTVEVINADASFFGLGSDYCEDQGLIQVFPSQPGGVLSGAGTFTFGPDYYFDPSTAGLGPHYIKYTTSLGCASDSQLITVHALPVVALAPFADVCQNAASFTLTNGSPSGGLYQVDNGPFITVFNPAAYSSGSHVVTYLYQDEFGCGGSATGSIYINLPSIPTSFSVTECDSYILPWGGTVTSSGAYVHTYTNATGCDSVVTANVTINSCSVAFDVHVFIQGYMDEFNPGFMKSVLQTELGSSDPSEVDTVSIILNDASTYEPVDTFRGLLHTDGLISCTFDDASGSASYYISVIYKNTLETWSAAAVPMSDGDYDFSSDLTQAYPDLFNPNPQMVFVDGVWTIYSGDVDQSGSINGDDFNVMEPDVTFPNFGYNVTDLTGDGIPSGLDYNLLEPNVSYGLFLARPF